MAYTAVQGSDVILFFDMGDGFLPFVCAKDFSIERTASLINITTVGDGQANKYAYQSTDYTISCSGVVVFDEANITSFSLILLQQNFLEVAWKAVFVDKYRLNIQVYKGTCLVERSLISANAGQVSLSDFTLRGSGEISDVQCDLTIGSIEVTDTPGVRQAIINDVTGGTPASFAWQLDNGFEQSAAFSPFTIGWPANGEHVLLVTPLCEDGSRGLEFSYDFLVSGQPGCAAVENVLVLNRTQTSFDVHYTIVGPVGSGYKATLVNMTTLAVTEFTGTGSTIACTGLTANTLYNITVVTLCGAEESEGAIGSGSTLP